MVEITKEFLFEAAHHLPPVGPDHKCFGMHGHLFRVEVTVAGEIDPVMGWVMDFGELASICRDIISRLDHRVLNDVQGLGVPTSENIARYLFDNIAKLVPGLASVTVHESPFSRCTYRPRSQAKQPPDAVSCITTGDPILASAAHFLLFPPDSREPIHGHDYLVTAFAWVPFGAGNRKAFREVMEKLAAELDHRLLLPESPTVGTLTRCGHFISLEGPQWRIEIPAHDCCILPCRNTTTEAIAQVLLKRLAESQDLTLFEAKHLAVKVTEGAGASAYASTEIGF